MTHHTNFAFLCVAVSTYVVTRINYAGIYWNTAMSESDGEEKNYRDNLVRGKSNEHIIQQLSLNWQHTRENSYTLCQQASAERKVSKFSQLFFPFTDVKKNN